MRKEALLIPLYQGEWRGPDRLGNLPKVTQLVRGGAQCIRCHTLHMSDMNHLLPLRLGCAHYPSGVGTWRAGSTPQVPGCKASLKICSPERDRVWVSVWKPSRPLVAKKSN